MTPLEIAQIETNAALQQFFVAVRVAWFKIVQTEEHVHIYKVAYSLCEADGRDPLAVTMGYPKTPAMVDAKGALYLGAPIRPNWALYWSDAVVAIEAVQRAETETAKKDAA